MENDTLLVIEDDEPQLKTLQGFLINQGFNVLATPSSVDGIKIASENAVDVILTDFRMPEKDGMNVLNEVKRLNPEISVIIMTAFGEVETAVQAMKAGAFDYLTKPLILEEVELIIRKALEGKKLLSENRELREKLADKYRFDGIVYASTEMEEVLNVAGRSANSKASILIYGDKTNPA